MPGTLTIAVIDVPRGAPAKAMLVDYAMPGLSGIEVARAARAKNPDLPIIIVTGYADAKFFDAWIDGAQLLRKPCRLQELANAIKAALAHRGAPPSNVLSMAPRRS